MSTPLGDNLKERIGNTPLLRFDRLTSKLDGVQVLAKADDSALGQAAVLSGGRTTTRGAALVHLSADWADHYSAAAMYLRLNDLLPPTAKKPAEK